MMGISGQALWRAGKKAGRWLLPRGAPGGRTDYVGHLSGKGIELGALKDPLDLSTAAGVEQVVYVDQHRKADLIRLFPELSSVQHQIVDPDVTCNISEGLEPFEAESLDFVVANHLIEHLPNPIFFLREVWRVLRPGGKLYLGVPDRNYNFDRDRPLTPALHLVRDYLRAVKVVEDEHLAEFITLSDKMPLPEDPQERAAFLELHRQRSIHVHVWDVSSFCRFLLSFLAMGPWPFRVLALSTPAQNLGGEIIFVLEKTRSRDLRRLVQAPVRRMMGLAVPPAWRQGIRRGLASVAPAASSPS